MKVLLLTTHLNIGGISTCVVNLARKLKQNGVEVLVGTSGGALMNRLERENIPWYQIPVKTKHQMHPKILFSVLKLLEIIQTEKIDLIHAHTRVTQVVAAILRRLTRVPYVTTCHGIFKRRLSRRLFPCWGARVTAISEPVRESLVNDFEVAKNQAVLMPNAIDFHEFDRALSQLDYASLRQLYNLNGSGFVVGSIARFEKVKGQRYIIEAIPHVLRKHPQTKFLFVGDGKNKSSLMRLVEKMKLKEHVIFWEATETVALPLGLIDIFVHVPAFEGFGLSILEAMSASRPVIASNVGGIYMLVKDEENGFLVPPHDPIAIAERINELIENPEKCKAMGARGREFAQFNFSVDHLAQNMIEMYREVIRLTKKK